MTRLLVLICSGEGASALKGLCDYCFAPAVFLCMCVIPPLSAEPTSPPSTCPSCCQKARREDAETCAHLSTVRQTHALPVRRGGGSLRLPVLSSEVWHKHVYTLDWTQTWLWLYIRCLMVLLLDSEHKTMRLLYQPFCFHSCSTHLPEGEDKHTSYEMLRKHSNKSVA